MAKLYGVSLDELLKTDDGVETIVQEQVKEEKKDPEEKPSTNEEDGIHIHSANGDKIHFTKDGLYILDEDGDEVTIKGGKVHIKNDEAKVIRKRSTLRIVEGMVVSSLVFIVTVLYVVLGCIYDGVWPYPLVWPIGWVGYLLIPLTACIFETIRKKTFSSFDWAIIFLSVIAYMIMGFVFNLWHPGWAVFFLIPLYGIFAESMDKAFKKKEKDDDVINVNLDLMTMNS